jgi:hypothetical protein
LAGRVERTRDRNMYKIVVGKSEGRPFGRPKRRWEENIKMNLREAGCELDSSGSGQGPVVGCCEHGNEHSGSMNG